MATKDAMIKKRLIKEGIILFAVLVALGIGGYVLSGYDDDSQTEKQNRDTENASLRSEHDGIQQELGMGFEVSAFYDRYISNHNSSFVLDREAASQLLNTLREKNHLANLSVTISPLSDINIDPIHLKSGTAVKSDVRLTFGATTDNSIYGFIESLERAMPGIIAIKDLKFTRTGDLSSAVVVGLSQHRITPLVTGELTFVWLGIKPVDAAKAPAFPQAGGGR